MMPAGRTDRELGELDVPALLRAGLGAGGPAHAALFGDGAIAAAIAADRLGAQPGSLAFLAEVVRRGGSAYAAQLPEPLPGAERAALARDGLDAAGSADTADTADAAGPAGAAGGPASPDPDVDLELARWLDAVAVILGVRQHSAPPR
jgi:hypothetical protein